MRYQIVCLVHMTLLSSAFAAPSPRGWWSTGGHRKQSIGGNQYSTSGGSAAGGSVSGDSATGGSTNEGNSSTVGLETTTGLSSNGSSASSSTSGVSVSTKKGCGTWMAAKEDVSWAYDWTDTPANTYSGPSTIDLVPLIGASSDLQTLSSSYKEVLGYNEPDGVVKVDVSTAIKQWPSVVATGRRVGSPASATPRAYDGGWIDTFMKGITQAGSHVDFMALHYYTADGDVSKLQAVIEALHDKYSLPIWVTEFGYVDYSVSPPTQPDVSTQIVYMQAAVKMMNGLSYVERFSWCDLPNSGKEGLVDGKALAAAYKAL